MTSSPEQRRPEKQLRKRSLIPGIIRHDFWRKFFSVCLAALVTASVYVVTRKDQTDSKTLYHVKPFLTFQSEEYDWRYGRETPEVALELKGPRSVLADLRPEDFVIKKKIGLKEYRNQQLKLTPADVSCTHPKGKPVEVKEIKPSELSLPLDHIITSDVPVRPVYDETELPPGYLVRKSDFAEDITTRKVTGPEQMVLKLKDIPTQKIPLKDQVADFTTVVPLQIPSGLKVAGDSVTLTVRISRIAQRRFLQKVNVLLPPETPEPLRISLSVPSVDVTVAGEKDKVEALLLTEIHPYVDLTNEIYRTPGVFSVKVRCDSERAGVEIPEIRPDTIQVTVSPAKTPPASGEVKPESAPAADANPEKK